MIIADGSESLAGEADSPEGSSSLPTRLPPSVASRSLPSRENLYRRFDYVTVFHRFLCCLPQA